MKCIGGVWLPDHEAHMVEWMTKNNTWVDGVLTYQWAKQRRAYDTVKTFGMAVDCGAHVGTWAMHMARRFRKVVAFEPCAEHRRCLVRNIPDDAEAMLVLHACALGDREGTVALTIPPGSCGGTHISTEAGTIPLRTLDSFRLAGVDFLKIDVEGFEHAVVGGGEETIRRDKPVIVIEQKPKGLAERYGKDRFAALDLLRTWGAKVAWEMSGDFCLTW